MALSCIIEKARSSTLAFRHINYTLQLSAAMVGAVEGRATHSSNARPGRMSVRLNMPVLTHLSFRVSYLRKKRGKGDTAGSSIRALPSTSKTLRADRPAQCADTAHIEATKQRL